MTQKTIKIFMNENYSTRPKKIFNTYRGDVYHIDTIWSLDILDLKVYRPENKRSYRYVLVIIDIFSKFGWTLPLKRKCSIIRDTFGNFFIIFKKKIIFNEN